MTGKHLEEQSRRVVAGLDENGRSVIVSDEFTPVRVASPAFTINEIWSVDTLPNDVLAENGTTGQVEIAPPFGGFVYLRTTFPPDSEWDPAASYPDSLAAAGNAEAAVEADGGIPGLHETDTVDIITVVRGELYAVLEGSETLLREGDSFVQRGTKHAWSNRSDKPASIVAVMMGAHRNDVGDTGESSPWGAGVG